MKPSLHQIGCAAALVTLVILSGCSGDGGDSIPSRDPTPETSATPTTVPTEAHETGLAEADEGAGPADLYGAVQPHNCSLASEGYRHHPYFYRDAGLSSAYDKVYADMQYCAKGLWATLENTGEGVWVIDLSRVHSAARSSLKSDFFRSIVLPEEEARANGVSLVAPGDVVNVSAAGGIAWAPHSGLTTAWKVQEYSLDRLEGYGRDYVTQTVRGAGGTNHSAAVWKCVEQTMDEINRLEELDDSSSSLDKAQAGLGAVQAGTCYQATVEADRREHAQRLAQSGQYMDELPSVKKSLNSRLNTLSGQLDEGIDITKLINAGRSVCVNAKIRFCF